MTTENDLVELIGEYWDLAWSEGRRGVSSDARDGAAQECLSAIMARIQDLEAANDAIEIDAGLTENGNLRRFWAEKARELAGKQADLIARAERAEAELARKTEALEQTEIERDNCIDAAKASWSKHGAMEMAKGQWQFRALAAEAKAKSLQEALTPSGDTKAAYIGEFKFLHTVWDPDGEDEIDHHITVPWTTIKEIMAAIAARSALEEKTDV